MQSGLSLPSGAMTGAPSSLQARWVRAVSPCPGAGAVSQFPAWLSHSLGLTLFLGLLLGLSGHCLQVCWAPALPTAVAVAPLAPSQHCRTLRGGDTHLELLGSCRLRSFAHRAVRAHRGVLPCETVPRSWGWRKATFSEAQGSLPAFALLLRNGLEVRERAEPARVFGCGLPGLPAARTEPCGQGAARGLWGGRAPCSPAPCPRVPAARGCEPPGQAGSSALLALLSGRALLPPRAVFLQQQ